MADGTAWVVSSDLRQLAEVRNEATHPTAPDYLVPPKLSAASATSPDIESISSSAQVASAEASTTIDVLVGYTDGFASARGGSSAALTRIHNLVDITNQAYANSQIDGRLRLVHAMQVAYADATSNKTALEEITGFRAPSTRIQPAPAFNALRTAREQYGADIVVLVRQFQNPENAGCGVAWLIGGGRSGVRQSDEFFGYSVVSDGKDQGADGKTYFCREETFAHEVGHNMGSQHDKATAGDSYGAFDYSFGYKTAAGAGNFYTVMAYGDSGQSAYRVFSNPAINICGGLPCGVANLADNARSHKQVMPVVAGFRAAKVVDSSAGWGIAGSGDMNGDGREDVVWHSPSHGLEYWAMNGQTWTYSGAKAVSSQYEVVGVGDFNGDGLDDILWRDKARTELWSWHARSDGTFSVNFLRAYPTGWNVAGIGDVNGDRKDDIFWHNPGGAIEYWQMNGVLWVYGGARPVPAIYLVAGIGDFNGDGRADVLWRDQSGTELWSWHSQDGGAFVTNFLHAYPSGWDVVGTGDVDGDGRDDIFWRNPSIGLEYWRMNGVTWSYGGVPPVASTYDVAALGDFNGDSRVDILWRDQALTELWTWQAQANGQFSTHFLRPHP